PPLPLFPYTTLFRSHPSDTAPALVALDARFRLVGPGGERMVPAADFFTLPRDNPARENVLGENEVLASVIVPRATAGMRSRYVKDRKSTRLNSSHLG